MIPSFAANGGIRLTSVRRQIAFTTDGFTRTSLQGSPGRPGPRYLKPFAPGGLPSAVQRAAGRPYVLSPAPVAVSKMRRVAPTAVGTESGSGRSKLVTALATNLASAPVFTTAIVPGISSSGSFAARVGTMADTTAPRIRTGTSERAMRPPPPPVTRAAGPGCPHIAGWIPAGSMTTAAAGQVRGPLRASGVDLPSDSSGGARSRTADLGIMSQAAA